MEQGTDIESSLSKKKAMNGELESAGQTTLIKKNDDPNMEVAPIGSLFRFATTVDFIIFFLGFIFSIVCSATMPGICIAFGDVIDSIAKPVNTSEVLRDSVIFMALLVRKQLIRMTKYFLHISAFANVFLSRSPFLSSIFSNIKPPS